MVVFFLHFLIKKVHVKVILSKSSCFYVDIPSDFQCFCMWKAQRHCNQAESSNLRAPSALCILGFSLSVLNTLPSVAGVPKLLRHYKSHKYHLTPLQQAGFDIKPSSRGAQPFSTIILWHTYGEEPYSLLPTLLTNPTSLSTHTFSLRCLFRLHV